MGYDIKREICEPRRYISGSGLICYILKNVKGGAECSRYVFMTSPRNHEWNCNIHRTEIKHEVVPVYVMTAYGGGSAAPLILNLITSDTGGWTLAPSADFEGAPKWQSPTGHTLIRSTIAW
jgi:hypothetical protein